MNVDFGNGKLDASSLGSLLTSITWSVMFTTNDTIPSVINGIVWFFK
jgi:hypothetical protein